MLRERNVKAGTTGGAATRVYFFLTDATDYVTPETGEAGGQPQISTNGGAWTNTGIGTLTSIGSGSYYADLTTGAVATAGQIVLTRYKSSNTSEARGTSVIVTVYDPSSDTQTVSLGTSTIGSSQIVDGALTRAKFGSAIIDSTTLGDGAITAAKLASNTVTAAKIADDAITGAKLATGALSSDTVAANAFVAASFATDLNAYSIIARLVQTTSTTQKVVVIIYGNGAPLVHATFAAVPTLLITNTAGDESAGGESMTAFGAYGYYYALGGSSVIPVTDPAEAIVAFTIGATSYVRAVPIEKQYA